MTVRVLHPVRTLRHQPTWPHPPPNDREKSHLPPSQTYVDREKRILYRLDVHRSHWRTVLSCLPYSISHANLRQRLHYSLLYIAPTVRNLVFLAPVATLQRLYPATAIAVAEPPARLHVKLERL